MAKQWLCRKKISWIISIMLSAVLISACAIAPPKPSQIIPPKPILGNSGEYMCPYTQDGVVAPWCDKAINAAIGSTIGRTAGAFAGEKALSQVPIIGGYLGSKVGDAIGRKIAIQASGGIQYIKDTSDISFNSVDDLIVWLYVTKSSNENYQSVYKATSEIYPEFKKEYAHAIENAPRRQ